MDDMDLPPMPRGGASSERADAVRNRAHLLATAREMLDKHGTGGLTMDALAEQSGLGKGTVYRRFGSRAGIFHELLNEDEQHFQDQVLSGPPPLGPDGRPLERLIAYGRARVSFLVAHHGIARASLDGRHPSRAGTPLTQSHIKMLLKQLPSDAADVDLLALQLTAALDGPLLLYLSSSECVDDDAERRLGDAWQELVQGLFGA